MILPDLVLASRANQKCQYSGIDSIEHCLDRKHFENYPYPIDYSYNSRGFRDQEWPSSLSELKDAVWCVGDSFTVGIGQPLEHIWPYVLAQRLNSHTINISMDGASNDWICRRVLDIREQVNPRMIVVMWSYVHRRESPDERIGDEKRRIHATGCDILEDILHFSAIVDKLAQNHSPLIQSAIPGFSGPGIDAVETSWKDIRDPTWPQCPKSVLQFDNLPSRIKQELSGKHKVFDTMLEILRCEDVLNSILQRQSIIYVRERLDWARDHHHFDIKTARWFVDQVIDRLS